MTEITAYPLSWPMGWRRHQSHERQSARFSKGRTQLSVDGHSTWQKYDKVTIGESVRRVVTELGRMGVPDWDVVISSNLEVRLDGLPRSNQRAPDDPGIAVYWGKGKAKRCMAIDRYDRIADNLAAVAATLYAMRAIERHGGAEILDRAFTGFIALPAPEQPWQVLGVGANATADEIEAAYRKLAAKHHPDRPTGSAAEMARINAARDDLHARLRT
jgi:hypothetical protein